MTVLKEINIGESVETTLEPVSRMDLIKYSGSSGDFNPIHTIDEEAKKAGLPGIIAHGMWTMGNLAKLFTPYHEDGFIRDYNIRFSGMVFLNDVLTLKAELVDKTDRLLIFDVKATNQNHKDVVSGNLKFELN
ncbi:MaoC/PaaZ C-terminal domain-containing protein [Ureibacillus aquaedulcis]|uniref:MaoC/PaaZ C-terminal domain-containing protein n=1 Tax=Ureibacillus aquaedulcis TaxID=3058421 RepID=A0ABT8GQ31_9BACL|nr:MaoC/PaaZ C-terminal domain-containing protein [Ureibacillus sp. BA0131]MDN4493518.1 MaoC/PaaZ C-terminal domain-containing protein [Ureibacillus sp. BA0131]